MSGTAWPTCVGLAARRLGGHCDGHPRPGWQRARARLARQL